MVAFEVGVGVPSVRIAAIKLHETDAPFQHAPGEQTTGAKLPCLDLVRTIEPFRHGRFLGEVDQVGRVRLHPEGQFVGVDARVEFEVVPPPGLVLAVHLADEVERALLLRFLDSGRRGEVLNRRRATT